MFLTRCHNKISQATREFISPSLVAGRLSLKILAAPLSGEEALPGMQAAGRHNNHVMQIPACPSRFCHQVEVCGTSYSVSNCFTVTVVRKESGLCIGENLRLVVFIRV